jgi:pimeloyl-ACP methyl ester carboxylesterase
MRVLTRFLVVLSTLLAAQLMFADDSAKLLSIDHYVRVQSAVPAIKGQDAQIYVREVVQAGPALRGATGDKVVLFIHGAGTPAEVSFDVPYQDYSWMGYLARAGFDVFSMDMTGYGRSSRPAAMSDPCNLSKEQQTAYVGTLIPATCTASYAKQMTTIASDWSDINNVVDHIRQLRRVDKLNLVAWSLGGPRAGVYAAQHPEKVQRMVLLAPGYFAGAKADPPAETPAPGIAFNTQSRAEFIANWDRQVGCPGQYDSAARDAVWKDMIESDPVGATWGPGVRRAPNVTLWGWTPEVASKTKIPTLMVSGVHDKQVAPDRVRELYKDLGATQKVFVDLGCSSHNAMWEKNHLVLFDASLEWLTRGTVKGKQEGMMQLGY